MPANFELARSCHANLREFILAHPAGRADEEGLHRVIDLCRTALSAVNDSECIESLGRVEDLARDLFSDDAHSGWARPGLAGTAVLKMELLRTLVAFRSRIAHLQLREVDLLVPMFADHRAAASRPEA